MQPAAARLVLAGLVAGMLTMAACGGGGGGSVLGPGPGNPSPSPSPALPTPPPNPTPTPMSLALGAIVGSQLFPNGDTATGGQGSPVDGIPCDNATITYHIHSHVTLFHNGTQVALPIAIGLMNPVYTMGGTYANDGTCFYHLHTHDNSGIVHVENDGVAAFTLGQLFDIWGMPLSADNVAGFAGPMIVYVGTSLYGGDPRAIVFGQHEQITLEVGGPYVFPPFYTWSY